LPPKASLRIYVSLEFLKPINCSFFLSIYDKADITFPSCNKLWLIFTPYLKVAPTAPVFLALSDPAKSAKKNREWVVPVIISSYDILALV
jgi:hypothetical protein